jgi:hypothetical protein
MIFYIYIQLIFNVMRKVFLFLVGMFFLAGHASATVYYVDGEKGTDYADGLSWSTAFQSVESPFFEESLAPGDEIWIVAGEYDLPDGITLKDGVNIYGGFAGTETSASERAKVSGGKPWEFVNPTVLTRSTGGYVFSSGASGSVIIDGITFKGTDGVTGKAINISGGANTKGYVIRNCIIRDFNSAHDGGGMNFRSKNEIAYCLITNNTGNKGGGAYLDYTTIHDCEITNNSVPTDGLIPRCSGNGCGGGLLVASSAPGAVYNCRIEGNTASFGGGIVVRAGSSMYNSIITGNTASQSGGGIAFDQRDNGGTIYNVTIANNTAEGAAGAGGICFSADEAPRTQNVYNTILFGNKTGDLVTNIGYHLQKPELASVTPNFKNNIIDKSDYEGFTIGEDCVIEAGSDNLFNDLTGYVTKATFPGKNKGLMVGITLPDTDMAGNARIIKNTVDIGPFEIEELEQVVVPNANGVIFVDAATTVSNDPDVVLEIGSTWATALPTPAAAVMGASKYLLNHPGKTVQIWVKAGTYTNVSVELKNGISLYGGFAGTETQLSDRAKGGSDFEGYDPWNYVNETVLSGFGRARTAASDGIASNAVIKQADEFTSPVVVDGFTLTNGEHGVLFASGGNTTLRNCIIKNNGNTDAVTSSSSIATGIDGGGVAIRSGSFKVTNCLIEENEAKNGGGVIIANDAPSVVEYSTIRGNKALATINTVAYQFTESSTSVFGWGGGVFNQGGTVNNCLIDGNQSIVGGGILVRNDLSQFNNCIIVGNSAVYGGGASYDPRLNATVNAGIYNCLFDGNQVSSGSDNSYLQAGIEPATETGDGGAIYFTYYDQKVFNSIFTNNDPSSQTDFTESINYSIVDDEALVGVEVITVPAGSIEYNGAWEIVSDNFPGIDAGIEGNPTTTDYAGNQRVYGNGIDIGPFEIGSTPPNAINEVNADGSLVSVRYYNLQGVEIKQPVRGEIYIQKKIYDNRKTEAVKGLIR